jgi:hypothetical protein
MNEQTNERASEQMVGLDGCCWLQLPEDGVGLCFVLFCFVNDVRDMNDELCCVALCCVVLCCVVLCCVSSVQYMFSRR